MVGDLRAQSREWAQCLAWGHRVGEDARAEAPCLVGVTRWAGDKARIFGRGYRGLREAGSERLSCCFQRVLNARLRTFDYPEGDGEAWK